LLGSGRCIFLLKAIYKADYLWLTFDNLHYALLIVSLDYYLSPRKVSHFFHFEVYKHTFYAFLPLAPCLPTGRYQLSYRGITIKERFFYFKNFY